MFILEKLPANRLMCCW